jgi:hypothetical protein
MLRSFEPLERVPVPIIQGMSWLEWEGSVRMDAENLASMGVRTPTLPACSEWLYRLHHPGRQLSLFSRDVTLFCLELRQNATPAPHSGDWGSNTFWQTDYPVWTFVLPLSCSRRHERAHSNLTINSQTRSLSPVPPNTGFRNVAIHRRSELLHDVSLSLISHEDGVWPLTQEANRLSWKEFRKPVQ